jgi:hypothetical protein
MRSAIRHLVQYGVEALKAQRVESKAVQVGSQYIAKPSKIVWRSPVVSKRVAKVIRNQAIQEGTFGRFDPNTGIGWDPEWDLALMSNRYTATRFGGIRPSKKTSRERSREERAQKIEAHLETRFEKMEEYYSEKEASRVKEKGFEAKFKQLSKGSLGAGR